MEAKASITERLMSWFRGSAGSPGAGGSVSDVTLGPSIAPGAGGEPPPWDGDPNRLMLRLWGEGFGGPGGLTHADTMTTPFALNLDKVLLDLSPGLGGGTVMLAEKYGCYVDGFELSQDLLDGAKRTFPRSAEKRKLKINLLEPAELKLKPRSYDCVLAQEALYRTTEKVRLLKLMAGVLRIDGMASFTDFVSAKDGPLSKGIERWQVTQLNPVHLWSRQLYDDNLDSMKLDVRAR